jgi:cytochrome P450
VSVARTASFPALDLRHRPDLFGAFLAHPFGEEPVVEAKFGGRRGWIFIEPVHARALLRRRDLEKGRGAASRAAAGGYPALEGDHFRRRRSEVIVALAEAASDRAAMQDRLREAVGPALPPRRLRPALLTQWMLLDLTGAAPSKLPLGTLQAGVVAAERLAEAIQAGAPTTSADRGARAGLVDALAACMSGDRGRFVDELRHRGWTRSDIVDELIALALAGWESTAAAVTSAITIGLGQEPRDPEIAELLRLYPPSWLIVRSMRGDEGWGAAGDLAVVSPWVTQRSAAWADADRFDPDRDDTPAAIPFGAGPRRCPADLYARTQLAVALGAFGGAAARPGHPTLIDHRSATLLPYDEQDDPR